MSTDTIKKGLWIRLDIPYSQDAVFMRGILAYDCQEPYPASLEAKLCKDIPETIQQLLNQAKNNNIIIDSSLCIVYPLDSRHNLAWVVKDFADKNHWNFSRNIPSNLDLAIDAPCQYENFDNGSSEENLSQEQSRKKILDLNAEARSSFNNGDIISAMDLLRHAFWLVFRHYNWFHPLCVYTLRNFAYTMIATGNDENIHEIRILMLKMAYYWQISQIQKGAWDMSSSAMLKDLSNLAAQMNSSELSIFFNDFYEKIKSQCS